ncbi:MAG: PIN domain-containing protein [Pseudonocardiales bacterium]|nr:PIN domain-containing protein [Pseudonocardiales bacterium]
MIPGGLYLADTSAIARVACPAVHQELSRLGRLGLLATCVTVDLEVLYSARTPAEHATTAARRAAGLVDLPLNSDIGARARAVQAMLAARSQHRAAGIVDLLTASTAEHYHAIVLHYDSDFDHIAAVTGQDTRWVVPRGSAG